MRDIVLPLSHICVDFYLIFVVFILENIFIQRDGVDGYPSIFVAYYMYTIGQGSSVGIATRLRVERSGDRIPVTRRDFPHSSRPALRSTQPPVHRKSFFYFLLVLGVLFLICYSVLI